MGASTTAALDYGQDAPGLMRGFFAAAFGLALVTAGALWLAAGWVMHVAATLTAIGALYAAAMGAFMVRESRVGKVRDRDRLLDAFPWRGDERVLDVGCGRGLMLIGAAERIPRGQAVGVDIWRDEDQSANRPEATLANAAAAGVAARVEVLTADMTALPFPDGGFDLVLSAWAIHNLPNADARRQALAEMLRMLRPGGRLLVTDISGQDDYPLWLGPLGAGGVRIEILHPVKRRIMAILSFGSFAPFALLAMKF